MLDHKRGQKYQHDWTVSPVIKLYLTPVKTTFIDIWSMHLGLGDSAKMFEAQLVNGLQDGFMGLLSNADPAHFLELSTLPFREKKTFCNGQSLEILAFLLKRGFPETLFMRLEVRTEGNIRETLSPV